MIVVDASVLVAYLERDAVHHEAAVALLGRSSGEELRASPVTLAEVLVVPARLGRLTETREIFRELELQEVPLQSDAAVQLATLRAATALKMPDCCVLLAAETVGGAVAAFDERLVAAAEGRGLRVVR